MPGAILHQGATVLCMHGGQAKETAPVPRVKVNQQSVVVQTSPHSISGCPFTTASPQPCVTATWTSAATRVKVNGMPVLLSTSTATCVPNGTGVVITVTQTRVMAQ